MGLAAGRRPSGRRSERDDAEAVDWEGDPTTVSMMEDFPEEVVGSIQGQQPVDIDADTLFDEDSVDVLLATFAQGTEEFEPSGRGPRRASVPPPPTPPAAGWPNSSSSELAPLNGFAPPATYPTGTGPFLERTPPGPDMMPPQHSGYHPTLASPYGPVAPAMRSSAAQWLIPSVALVMTALAGVFVGKVLLADSPAPVPPAQAIAPPPATANEAVASTAPAEAARPGAAELQVEPSRPASSPPPGEAAEPEPEPALAAASGEPVEAAEEPPSEPAPSAAPLTVEVASLEHPVGAAVTASVGGEVVRSHLQKERRVRKNEKLFELRYSAAPAAKARQLAARIEELKGLAAEDPVYEAFLDKARAEYRKVQRSSKTVVVRAEEDGRLESLVKRGDRVARGEPLARRLDTRRWIATGLVTGSDRPDDGWSCALVHQVSGERAPCQFEQTSGGEGRLEVTALVEASQAPWLADIDSPQQLALELLPVPR